MTVPEAGLLLAGREGRTVDSLYPHDLSAHRGSLGLTGPFPFHRNIMTEDLESEGADITNQVVQPMDAIKEILFGMEVDLDGQEVDLNDLVGKVMPHLHERSIECSDVNAKIFILVVLLEAYSDQRTNFLTPDSLQTIMSDQTILEVFEQNSISDDKNPFRDVTGEEWQKLVDYGNHIINCQAILKHSPNKVICMKACAILTGFDNCLVGNWRSLGKAVKRRHLLFHYFTGIHRGTRPRAKKKAMEARKRQRKSRDNDELKTSRKTKAAVAEEDDAPWLAHSLAVFDSAIMFMQKTLNHQSNSAEVTIVS